jgi:adenylate cyclase
MTAPPLLLRDHWQCFEGIIPSIIVTAARDGTPNVSYISHVFLIDEDHVALSNQFMSKMLRNIQENPRVQASIVHPESGHQLILDLIFDRSETSGPLFDQLSLCVTAVAAHQGMDHVMRLRSADVYRVLKVSCEDRPADDPAFVTKAPSAELSRIVPLCLDIARQTDLGQAIDLALGGLGTFLGIRHSIAFLADPDPPDPDARLRRTAKPFGGADDRRGRGARPDLRRS